MTVHDPVQSYKPGLAQTERKVKNSPLQILEVNKPSGFVQPSFGVRNSLDVALAQYRCFKWCISYRSVYLLGFSSEFVGALEKGDWRNSV